MDADPQAAGVGGPDDQGVELRIQTRLAIKGLLALARLEPLGVQQVGLDEVGPLGLQRIQHRGDVGFLADQVEGVALEGLAVARRAGPA